MNIIHLLYLHVYFIKNLHVVMFHTSRICLPSITKYAVKTSPNANLFLPLSSFAQNSVFRYTSIHHIYFHQRLIFTRHFALQNIDILEAPRYIVFLKKYEKFQLICLIQFLYIFIHINFGANDVIDTGASFYSTECTFIFAKCGLF